MTTTRAEAFPLPRDEDHGKLVAGTWWSEIAHEVHPDRTSQKNTGSRELLDETTDDEEDYCLQRSAVPLDPRV